MIDYQINYHFDINKYEKFDFDIEINATKIDLKYNLPLILNQGKLKTCAAVAVASLYDEFFYKKIGTQACFSPMYLYYLQSRKYKFKEDDGLYIIDCLESLKTYGICEHEMYPIQHKFPILVPSDKASKNASESLKVNKILCIEKLGQIHQSLIDGYSVVIGSMLYDGFYDILTYKYGKMQLPKDNEKKIGAHAFLVVGFIQTGSHQNFGVLILRNSRGGNWGHNGYCYMPYEYFKEGFVFDAWTIR